MSPELRMHLGNLLLVVCCGFYLLWWGLAFRPEAPIKGMRTGWLLIPAALAGLSAVVVILTGVTATPSPLFSHRLVLVAGVLTYLALLLVTFRWMGRPVTTELFLIVGWGMLALVEVNGFCGAGKLAPGTAAGLCILVMVVAVVSLVCYVLYDRLNERLGYLDGMVPLVLAPAVMLVISAAARG